MPRRIRVDNGAQFNARGTDLWGYTNDVVLDHPRPGNFGFDGLRATQTCRVDRLRLSPGARGRPGLPAELVAALALGHGRRTEVGGAVDPIRKIAVRQTDDLGSSAAIKGQRTLREVCDDRQAQVAFEAGVDDEAPEEARQRDLRFTGLTERFLEGEWRPRAGTGEELIENRPGAVGSPGV